jgi:flagellar basal-body rod modification protein FlgD
MHGGKMATAMGFLNHQMTTAQAFGGRGVPVSTPASATSATNSASGADASGTESATISANDFLTLLVTEMKNQDPTANTDPNEYINQLVSVNSLEQLIDINQNLTTALGGASNASPVSTSAPSSSASPGVAGLTAANAAAQLRGAAYNKASESAASVPTASGAASVHNGGVHPIKVRHAPGNLGVPEATAASNTVAHALGGRSHSPTMGRLTRTQ